MLALQILPVIQVVIWTVNLKPQGDPNKNVCPNPQSMSRQKKPHAADCFATHGISCENGRMTPSFLRVASHIVTQASKCIQRCSLHHIRTCVSIQVASRAGKPSWIDGVNPAYETPDGDGIGKKAASLRHGQKHLGALEEHSKKNE